MIYEDSVILNDDINGRFLLSAIRIIASNKIGTGFVVKIKENLFLSTNDHVIDNSENINIEFYGRYNQEKNIKKCIITIKNIYKNKKYRNDKLDIFFIPLSDMFDILKKKENIEVIIPIFEDVFFYKDQEKTPVYLSQEIIYVGFLIILQIFQQNYL